MLIENVRLSFPSLFKPTAFQAGQDPKYSATLIIPKDHPQVDTINAAISKCAEDKWGQKAGAVMKAIPADKKGLRDGDSEKGHLDGFADSYFFNASTGKRPSVFHRDRTPLTAEDDVIYPGCYVNVQVEPWAQDNQYGKRINWTLRGVQFREDGESFGAGGAPASEDEFPQMDATGTDDFMS